jgi:hypothetical protein
MDDAIKAFERAVQNGDSEGLATLQLSELYIDTGRVADGMQMLECSVENAMQVSPRKHVRAVPHSVLQNQELPSPQSLQCMLRLATLLPPLFLLPCPRRRLVVAVEPAPAFTRACRYSKDGMWLKVQPLCEKVSAATWSLLFYRSCTPFLILFHQILECASALGHGHVMMGGGAKFRDDAMALLREVPPCLKLFARALRRCSLLTLCLPPLQARIATGRGAAEGVDDSLCEDDI